MSAWSKFIWGADTAMLVVNAIDLHYGAAQALRAVSIKAEPGKVTCVLGRNGVGKTSLLDALAGQQSVSRGTITWEGSDITALRPPERARRGISYVPQGREIFPLLTVEENLKTGFAQLQRYECSIPDDVFSLFPVLRDMLRRRGGDLSGGQQQQLAIGRALVMRPRLLLLAHLLEQPAAIGAVKGRAQGQQLVQGYAQAVDVAARIRHAVEAFGGHVAEGPDHVAGAGQVLALALG